MVAIIIVHYGRIETTLACLASLNLISNPLDQNAKNADFLFGHLRRSARAMLPNFLALAGNKKDAFEHKNYSTGFDIRYLNNVIVVNNSQKNIQTIIQDKFDRVTIINNPKNLGYAAALNKGIKLVIKNKPDYLLILNNDVTVKKKFLHDLLHFVKKHRADLVSPKILDQNGNIWFDGGEIDKNRYTAGHKKGKFDTFDGAKRRSVSTLSDPAKGEGVERVDFLSGCCLLIKKEVFEKIGFFNEQYFMYYEDVDFCLRAKKLGFKLGIAKKVIACHDIKRTKKGTKLMEYYLARNHLLFVKKHAPLFVKIRELIRLPKTLWEHWRKKEWEALKGIKDFFQKDLFR